MKEFYHEAVAIRGSRLVANAPLERRATACRKPHPDARSVEIELRKLVTLGLSGKLEAGSWKL